MSDFAECRVVRGMDIVYIIITAMLVCAAACAIVLVWPERDRRKLDPVTRDDHGNRSADSG